MDLILTRKSYNSWGIVSELTDTNGNAVAVTLEHAYPDSTGLIYRPKLNAGAHECVLGTHSLDHGGPFEAYEITGVPGHSGILFHIGNYNSDSNGCVLIGTALGERCVTGSRSSFTKFMALQGNANFTLTVVS